MARLDVPTQVHDAVAPIVHDAGLFLEDLEYLGSGPTTTIRVTVDLPEDVSGPVGLETISSVSRDLSTALDSVSVLHSQYTLEVSSPGTSRPLTQPRHFRRNVGRLISVKSVNGERFTERLVEVTDDAVLFDTRRHVALADIRRAKVEVELGRVELVDDNDFQDVTGADSGRFDDSED